MPLSSNLLDLVCNTSDMSFLAIVTPSLAPPTRMKGSFLLLAPILSLEGQMMQVSVMFPIRSKNCSADSPKQIVIHRNSTVWPRSFDPFKIVSYCIKRVKASWSYSINGRERLYHANLDERTKSSHTGLICEELDIITFLG